MAQRTAPEVEELRFLRLPEVEKATGKNAPPFIVILPPASSPPHMIWAVAGQSAGSAPRYLPGS